MVNIWPLAFLFFIRFTAAVRATFNFTGEEKFAFSGGEELWVYIDKKLVVQIFSDPSGTDSPCRTISLADAGKLHCSIHQTDLAVTTRGSTTAHVAFAL